MKWKIKKFIIVMVDDRMDIKKRWYVEGEYVERNAK